MNFSIVGRNCNQKQREEFFTWDNNIKERQRIADSIKKQAKGIDASIGGQISIDIYPEGKDKSQIIDVIDEREKPDYYIFIGDRSREGGNDYPLGYKIWQMKNGDTYQVDDGPNHTRAILTEIDNPLEKVNNNDGSYY